jgi:extracellular factor (EF) 3-hydroxypalmitic acid methyl ester biosynthesis protein
MNSEDLTAPASESYIGDADRPLAARLDAALSRCHELLTDGGAAVALARLVRDLFDVRTAAPSPEHWRTAVVATRAHPAHRRMREDPYTADAFEKPRGYAGDAHTLDYVYRHCRPAPDTTPLGCALHAVTTGVPIADAVRERRSHVAAVLRHVLARLPNAAIVSVACGYMRELHDVPVASLGGATLIGLDQDSRSTGALPALHPSVRIDARVITVRHLLARRPIIPMADLIYATGLFDYLEDGVAVALASALGRQLRRGGTLLIPNLTPHNEEIAFMEAVMDWWMVYRSDAEMRALGSAVESAVPGTMATVYALGDGRVSCLMVRARATPDRD